MADDDRPDDERDGEATDPMRDSLATMPIAVSVALLGILGGVCGEPVSVVLQDYPADLVGVLQRFLRRHVPHERVCEVFRPADLRRLGREGAEFALVLVYPTPGHPAAGLIAQWHLERDRRTRLPMVLLVGEQPGQELPGAVLGLGIGPAEVARHRDFFAGDPPPDPRVRKFFARPWGPRSDASLAGLRALFVPGGEPLWVPRSLRSVQVLRGLLAGHCLWRRLGIAHDEHQVVAPDLHDYAGVCDLLRRSRAGLPGEMGDPILAAMIRRANLHLRYREGASRDAGQVPAGRDRISSLPKARTGHRDSARNRPIGLRELADLGNVRSSLASRLIDAAMLSGDPEALSSLGLFRRLPAGTSPGSLDRGAIAGLMVTWSMKQVRKRFDRLRREGFIEAERVPAGNGPWVIHLPEELKPLPGEFQGLPPVERVAEACLPRRVTPISPPFTHHPGQTEPPA